MQEAGLDTTPRIKSVCKVPPGAGGQQLFVPSKANRVYICHQGVADSVEATR